MEIHEARPCRHIEPHPDVREDELNVRKAPNIMSPQHLFVRVGDVIVRNSNGLNFGSEAFQRSEVIRPSVTASELIVQNGSGGMDVRLPSPPLGSSIHHHPLNAPASSYYVKPARPTAYQFCKINEGLLPWRVIGNHNNL